MYEVCDDGRTDYLGGVPAIAGVELTAVVAFVAGAMGVEEMRFAMRAIFLRRAASRLRMLATTVMNYLSASPSSLVVIEEGLTHVS